MFPRETPDADQALVCPNCGWQMEWARYRATYRHNEFAGGTSLVEEYIHRWERARTAREKMLAIDWVIHRWHHETNEDRSLGRPFAVNLIEGSREQVLAFLDALTRGGVLTPGMEDHRRNRAIVQEQERRSRKERAAKRSGSDPTSTSSW